MSRLKAEMEADRPGSQMPAPSYPSPPNAETGNIVKGGDLSPIIASDEKSWPHVAVLHPTQPDNPTSPAAQDQTSDKHRNELLTSAKVPTHSVTVHEATSAGREEPSRPTSNVTRLSSKQKLGYGTILLFSVGTTIILTGFGILWFLWGADGGNELWSVFLGSLNIT